MALNPLSNMARGTYVIKVLLFVGVKAFLAESLDTQRLRYPMPGANRLAGYLENLNCEYNYFDFDAYLIRNFKTRRRSNWNDVNLNSRLKYQIHKQYDYILFSLPRYEHSLSEMRASVEFAKLTLQELRRLQPKARIVVGGLSWSCLDGIHPYPVDLIVHKHDITEKDLARILEVEKVRDRTRGQEPYNSSDFSYQNHFITDFFEGDTKNTKYPYGWVKQATVSFVDGCTNRCAFCVEYGNKIRIKTLQEISDEIKHLYFQKGYNSFYFLNTAINPNRKFAENFCNWIVRSDMRFLWSDSAKFHDTDREFFDMLYDAGCRSLCFGAETVDNTMLDYVDKNLTVDDIERGLINSHEAGIWNVANFIVGMPCETKESLDNTINFIWEHRGVIDRAVLNRFYMKQASGFYQNSKKYGLNFIRPSEYKDDLEFNINEFGLPGEKDILYWETNGRNLYDVYKQKKEIMDEVFHQINDGRIHIDVSQHLLFSLYTSYRKKHYVKNYLNEHFYPKLKGTLPLVKHRYSDET